MKIYGIPSSLTYRRRWAFQFEGDSKEQQDAINGIPTDTDILITHGPPYGACDTSNRGTNEGDVELMKQVEQRIRPKFHIFGHIHEAYGSWTNGVTTFINAASTRIPRSNLVLNDPIVFDIRLKDQNMNLNRC